MNNKVQIVGVNTSLLKVLSKNEMLKLFKDFQSGDLNAKDELVNGNLKLVLSILKKYTNRSYNMDDLFQVGVVGLIKAINNFDLSHDVLFSTYAVPMILGEIKRYIRDNSKVRISRSIKETAYKALKLQEELTNELGHEIDFQTLAKHMNITEYELAIAIESLKDTVSLSTPIYNDGGDTIYLEDQVASDNGVYDIDTYISLYDALEAIDKRERYIIIERYIEGKTQLELADKLGISQAQVSRLEKSGINNIKKLIK